MSARLLIIAACLTLMAPLARAQDCPADPPASATDRRNLAKQWFAAAEDAERNHDDISAVRAYQCSMSLVPHAFTAYNLARVAEQAGDLQLALESYHSYLTMTPDADDAPAVAARVQVLEARLEEIRTRVKEAPPPAVVAPAPAPPPVMIIGETPRDEPRLRLRTGDWVVMGAAGAALVSGGALNLMARSKMGSCRDLADQDKVNEALDACHGARPLAYASYALLGAAGAAVIIDLTTVLVWRRQRLSVTPMAGGARLTLRGRF
jgi:hypothetical protein